MHPAPHHDFKEDETESQRDCVTCPRPGDEPGAGKGEDSIF